MLQNPLATTPSLNYILHACLDKGIDTVAALTGGHVTAAGQTDAHWTLLLTQLHTVQFIVVHCESGPRITSLVTSWHGHWSTGMQRVSFTA